MMHVLHKAIDAPPRLSKLRKIKSESRQSFIIFSAYCERNFLAFFPRSPRKLLKVDYAEAESR